MSGQLELSIVSANKLCVAVHIVMPHKKSKQPKRPALPTMNDVFSASASETVIQPADVEDVQFVERDDDNLRRSGRERFQTNKYVPHSQQTPIPAVTPTPKGKSKKRSPLTPTTFNKTKRRNMAPGSPPPPLPKPLPIIINGVTLGLYPSLPPIKPAASSIPLLGPPLEQGSKAMPTDMGNDDRAAAAKIAEKPASQAAEVSRTIVKHAQLVKAVANNDQITASAQALPNSQTAGCNIGVNATAAPPPVNYASSSIYVADLLDSLTMVYASEGYSDLDEQIARAALLTSSIIPSAPGDHDRIPARSLVSIERTEAVLELLVLKYEGAVAELQSGGCF